MKLSEMIKIMQNYLDAGAPDTEAFFNAYDKTKDTEILNDTIETIRLSDMGLIEIVLDSKEQVSG